MNILLALLLAGAVQAEERKHTVVKGDHLWGLAKHYYANPYKWRAIHNANTFIKDPHWIYPGQVLVIPGMEVAAATPDEPFPPAELKLDENVQVPGLVVTKKAEEVAEAVAEAPKDGLSIEMPEQMSGQYPSMTRLKAPEGWRPDGEITVFEDREIMAAQGDLVNGKLKAADVKVGDKLYVLRKDAPEDTDADPKADYLVRVGMVEVRQKLKGSTYRLLILKSGDSLQVGDALSRKPL